MPTQFGKRIALARVQTSLECFRDGEGFKDAAASHSAIYATYKLALYLITADRLKISAPQLEEVLARLLAIQSTDGGWKTDYKDGKPVGLANVETTCLSLLALRKIGE